MPGASPLVDDLDTVLRLEDAGASAIVMHSLFEEQIVREHFGREQLQAVSHSSAEASSYFPGADDSRSVRIATSSSCAGSSGASACRSSDR